MICFCWWGHVRLWVRLCPPLWPYFGWYWHREFNGEHIRYLKMQLELAWERQGK